MLIGLAQILERAHSSAFCNRRILRFATSPWAICWRGWRGRFPRGRRCLYENGPRYTFAELEAEARLVARGLMAQGVGAGERVVLWATNVPEWIVLQFALAKIGAILVTANTSLRPRDIDYLLRQSEAATLMTIGGFRDVDYVAALHEIGATRRAIPGLDRLFFISRGDEAAPPGFTPYEALRAEAANVSDAMLDARSAAVGSRRRDQHAVHVGHDGLPERRHAVQPQHRQQRARRSAGCSGYTPEDRLCLCVPLFHCFGCVIGVLGAYTHGASLCPLESFDPGRVLATVERERCTALYGVPTMFLAELEHPEFARFNLTSLRTGVMAGALCPEPLMRRVMSDMHLPEITIVVRTDRGISRHHDHARATRRLPTARRRSASCCRSSR